MDHVTKQGNGGGAQTRRADGAVSIAISRGADWKEPPMSMSGMEPRTGETTDPDPFDLDIRIVEFGDAAVTVVNVTDDGCGSTCPRACATNVG